MTGNPAPNPPPGPRVGKGWGWYYRNILRWWRFGSKRQRIVNYAKASLAYAGRMHYTETVARSELFHRRRGDFKGAHADCSQFSASLCHWVGVKGVTDADWTGTLGEKGVRMAAAEAGLFVFFGAPPYVHMGVMEDAKHVIGFGTQSAPDRNTLTGLLAYFASQGHPGYAFRDLTR